jgi:prophage antirepressor-like protein
MKIIPFQTPDFSIRAVQIDGDPWFVGKDVAEALGYTNPSKAIGDHCKGVPKRYPLPTAGGVQEIRIISEPDLFRLVVNSQLPSADKFERWVFEEVLPTIRKTGGYQIGKQPELTGVLNATKVFQPLFRIARQIGLDKNAAAISANQATLRLSGQNVLQLMGQTHLEAENQDSIWFTPTELGKARNLSGRAINLLLAEAGLQHKVGEHWTPTDQAEGFYRLFDTGKKHSDGTLITQVKWAENVLNLIQRDQVA